MNKGKSSKKIKKSQKGKRNTKERYQVEQQQDDDEDIIISPQQSYHQHPQQYEAPQDLKIRLANKVLSQVKAHHKQTQDDFFIEPIEQGKLDKVDNIAEQLKLSYFREKNRLYQSINSQTYTQWQPSQPTTYQGHLQCITAIHLTAQHIYSCSKDRSIIKWDRETKKKDFISLGKLPNHHTNSILSMALHFQQGIIATAGDDQTIKLWDTKNLQLIDTLKGHKNSINGISFGRESFCLASVSSDRTFKQWDASQRGLIETYYGHRQQALDIDCISSTDFISSGNDHQIITWKTQKQTQVIFEGHDYAIDRVRVINDQRFISASQDGSVYLWTQRRKKPLHKTYKAHHGWISALDNIKQTNIFASGANDKVVKIWSIQNDMKIANVVKQIKVNGIVTDIKINRQQLAFTQCDEHRLGRWITTKCRNKIQVYKFKG